MLGPNLIDWKSRKQTLVTTSTTEAELVAMSEATKDLEWKLALLKEMTNRSDPAALLTDCQSGIKKLKREAKRLGFQKVKHLCDLIGLALVVNDEPSQANVQEEESIFGG